MGGSEVVGYGDQLPVDSRIQPTPTSSSGKVALGNNASDPGRAGPSGEFYNYKIILDRSRRTGAITGSRHWNVFFIYYSILDNADGDRGDKFEEESSCAVYSPSKAY